MIRLTGGYARVIDQSHAEFLCPAAWGDDLVSPAATIPGGPVVVAGSRGLYLVDANGVVKPHPDPLAAKPATDFARLGDKLYLLRSSGESSEILEVTASQVRTVFTDQGNWTSIAATSSAIGLQRLTDTRIEQARITADGMVLGRDSAPAPADPILVIARATPEELYAVVATATGRELGQIQGDQWTRIQLASSSIAGPVQVPQGDVFIAVDTELLKFSEPRMVIESAPPVSCLGRLGELAYACTRDGLSPLGGTVGRPLFRLSSMSPPDLTKIAPTLDPSQCETQWEHFRFDLLALGVTLMEPPVTADAGQGGMSEAGAVAPLSAGVGGAPIAMAGASGGAVSPVPSKAAADSGCTVSRRYHSTASAGFFAASFATLALAFVRRRAERWRRARSH
jgi:hypothetical protein